MGTIDPELEPVSDVHLINELETRGYVVLDIESKPNYEEVITHDVDRLYLDYMLTGPAFFDARIREFFAKHLNKIIISR